MRHFFRTALWLFSALALAACSGTVDGRRLTSDDGSGDPSLPFEDGGTSGEPAAPAATPNDVPPDPETLFEAPSGSPTANRIHGSWAYAPRGKMVDGVETRLWIGASKLMLARRCSREDASETVAVTVAIRIDATKLTTLEEKTETKDLETNDFTMPCTAAVVVAASGYVVHDFTLTLSAPSTKGGTVAGEEWIKLSD